MTADDALPVLVLDGGSFSDFAGFAREFSRLLPHHTWNGNLDAFDDILWGGFGTPEDGWVLRWIDSASSRSALGYEATVLWLEELRRRCHTSHRADLAVRVSAARRGEGPTLFDEIVTIIRLHAPGPERDDGVVLELR